MLFGEYNFNGVLEDDAILPPFKGSTFRGVFGRALKEVVCALKRQECPSCLLRSQCHYTQVFDLAAGSESRGSPLPPHPFVIEPPWDSRTHLFRGESFDFTLLLFGPANQLLAYFVYAFQEMGRIGIGRQVNGRRARFCLASVTCLSAGMIYREEDRHLLPGRPRELFLEPQGPPLSRVGELTVTLETPLRLKFQNRLQRELPFHVLMRAVLRRLAALFRHYGDGEPALDYRGLIARAQEVQTLQASLRWLDWERYSHRQKTSMFLGGLVGEITCAGELTEYMPLLRVAEKVHLGKNTTFGLGKIKVSGLPREAS